MHSIGDLPQLNTDLVQSQERSAGLLRICKISIGGELFAIDIRQVQEVFGLESMTPVPGMPASLVGVANLRGTIVPLIDLRAILNLSCVASPKYVVVVRHGSHHLGIVIDEVPETHAIDPDDLIAPSANPTGPANPFLFGFLKVGSRLCGVLEVSRLVASLEGAMGDARS